MTRRVAEAAEGTGEAKAALKELGLDARKLTKLPLEESFREIADAMGNVQGKSSKVRLAFKLFDSEGVALLNTLNLGKGGLEEYAAEAEKLGGTLDEKTIAAIERMNDRWTKTTMVLERAKNAVVGFVATMDELMSQALESDEARFARNRKMHAARMAEYKAETKEVQLNLTERVNLWLQAHKEMFANASWFFGQIGGMLAAAGEENRAIFELNKGIAIANAVVNVAQGVTKAFAHFGPFAWPAAAAIAAAGAVQIAAIAKTSPQGGASAPPAPSAAPAAAGGGGGGPVSNVNVTLSGEGPFGRDQVLALIESIQDAADDGARLNLAVA
jgi:hypothetical protein